MDHHSRVQHIALRFRGSNRTLVFRCPEAQSRDFPRQSQPAKSHVTTPDATAARVVAISEVLFPPAFSSKRKRARVRFKTLNILSLSLQPKRVLFRSARADQGPTHGSGLGPEGEQTASLYRVASRTSLARLRFVETRPRLMR